MEVWKRKSSERSPGETESSGSVSSLSERFSDEQDTSKASLTEDSPSPEVTSKTAERDEYVNDRIKNLTVKLSAALVNVSAKDDLVKQHSKVAEEVVAGWEKAENEVSALKQQLEAAVQQNYASRWGAEGMCKAAKTSKRREGAKSFSKENMRMGICQI